MNLNAAVFASLFAGAIVPAAAADLSITVTGVSSAEGRVMLALFNSADTFQKAPLRAAEAPARAGTVTLEIKDLPPGAYAFALYHDANGNGKLDTNVVGMPVEDYAFSNNAMGKRGAPSYEQARFEMPAAGAAVSVTLR